MSNGIKLKLLITDDEYTIREILRRTINWEANDIEVVGYARHGIEAMEFINKSQPDIVLADIKMPEMDGIKLSKWINENYPDIKVVLLSAYSEFEFAQEAIRNNVVDYILKPVKENLLFEVINKIRDGIIKHRMEKQEKFIQGVLKGNYESNMEELIRLYGIELCSNSYVAALISIDNYNHETLDSNSVTFESLKLELRGLIDSILKDPYKVYIFNGNNNSICIVFSVNSQYEKPYVYKGITDALERICDFYRVKGCILTIGVSNPGAGIKSLNSCYLETLGALKAKIYIGKGKVIQYSSLEKNESLFSMDACEAEKVYGYMSNFDWFNTQLSIKRYFDHYMANHNILEEHPQFIIYEMLAILKRVMAYNQESADISINRDDIDKLLEYDTLQEMYNGIINLFKKYYDVIIRQTNSNSNKIIKEIKEYINKNYMHDINLADGSKSAYLSPSALSKMFFKETGVLFTDYIIQCRMEKAKEFLLKSDLKIYEISEKVGYRDKKHFVKLFKNSAGVSPIEFRKKCRNMF